MITTSSSSNLNANSPGLYSLAEGRLTPFQAALLAPRMTGRERSIAIQVTVTIYLQLRTALLDGSFQLVPNLLL